MNREILFRGKSIDTGKWVYGGIHFPFLDIVQIIHTKGINMSHISQVDPYTVGQFTGLTDKNGTKIFEGDKTDGGEIVVFEDGVFGTTYEGNCQGVSRLSDKRCKYIQITGTIHDNHTT